MSPGNVLTEQELIWTGNNIYLRILVTGILVMFKNI